MKNKMVKSADIYGNAYDVSIDQLMWRPTAYAIIVNDDKILLVKERGMFHMPGGGIELGEMPEQAVIREVMEETGLSVINPRLAGTLSTFFTHKSRSKEPVHVQSLLLYYICDCTGNGELSIDGLDPDEIEYGLTPEWVPITDLDAIIVGSTVDWRGVVRAALQAK